MYPLKESTHYRRLDDLNVQRVLLRDNTRVDAYWSMINENKEIFYNKIVMEVGSGTGLLSILCAQVGAKKVYAVEESPKLVKLSEEVFADNNVSDKIEVLIGDIESLTLEEQIDVIISDWMGFFLIDGGLLNKVISARKFLNSDGIIIPGNATLYAAICSYEPAYRQWENINDVQLSAVTRKYKEEITLFPCREILNEKNINSKPKQLLHLDIKKVQVATIKEMTFNELVISTKEANADGLCIWWEVELFNGYNLTNSPFQAVTHWKQILLMFSELQELDVGTPLAICLQFKKVDKIKYSISLEIRDPERIEHEIPCECSLLKCLIIRTYLNKDSNELE